jgi:hypothetical protein
MVLNEHCCGTALSAPMLVSQSMQLAALLDHNLLRGLLALGPIDLPHHEREEKATAAIGVASESTRAGHIGLGRAAHEGRLSQVARYAHEVARHREVAHFRRDWVY